MGYGLINNQWTPKLSKKVEEGSISKGKEPVGRKVPKVEGFEIKMQGFMVQMIESMQTLHTKVDNVAFRLLFVKKKLRILTKEVRKGKVPMEESESEKEEEKENQEEEAEKEKEEKVKNEGGEGIDQEKEKNNDKDFSETDTSPTLIRKTSQRYTLRHSRPSKFKNTVEMTLKLSPSPFSTPLPITPVHDSSLKFTLPRTTPPPSSL
ncbi:uncharacterized protein LOC130768893 [Actinidia eriantha]|uniref:uncharacterized protein LOC130768893 n=1 Tax=Actinidia eriantha TaxID=165200 RepID=UPI0025855AF8|nr:uncharacterized protein LOC130768893 [Actinidia eriantha]